MITYMPIYANVSTSVMSHQDQDRYTKHQLVIQGERVTWIRPTSLTELLALKAKYPDARLVIGNTEIGKTTSLSSTHTLPYEV
jgi:xanthine dehydrogenase iron-sulfur cluster and FAD-binding subunit A